MRQLIPAAAPRALLAALSLPIALAGCSSLRVPKAAAVHERRIDLQRAADALIALERPLAAEIAASRSLWPLIDHGLLRRLHRSRRPRVELRSDATLARRLDAAEGAARQLPAQLLAGAEELTGPASGLAGLYALASGLATHSLEALAAAERVGPSAGEATASYLRGNVNMYVADLYDAHFDLSYIGKALRDAYRRMGGQRTFGARLSAAEVARIARFYSPANTRLRPHPWQSFASA
ncbi:MAG TPA: hypothetical protein VKU89_05455 [Solirubrobacteraceae bacterium]|nr:hypothetical protein [Solirubrobacteraceae bacterium]